MIDIDSITVGQIKQIAALAGGPCGQSSKPAQESPFIGQHVILRTYSAGVHAGYLVSRDGDVAVLRNSRRLWNWQAKAGVALSGLAQSGLKSGKVDTMLPLHEVIGVIEVIPTTDHARETINAA
jgi:hypothetical protein